MLRRTASVAILILNVASCSTAASPEETAVEPSPTSSSAVASPVASVAPPPVASVAPLPVASVAPPPVATASPSPTRTPRLDDVVTSFKLVSPGTGWVETDHGLLVTHDDGSSWVDASPNGDLVLDEHLVGVAGLGTLGLDAIDGQTAFVATEKTDGSTTTLSIWHTTDGGQTWRPAKVASVPALDTSSDCGCGGLAVLIDAVDPLVVFADIVVSSGTDSESHDVFRSRDGGVTWAGLSFGIHADVAPADLAIHFLTADTGSILFGERTFTTRTGWGHWSEYPEPGFGAVTYLDDRHWIMGLIDGPLIDGTFRTVRIAESTDAGRTWTTYTRPIPKTTNLSVSFVSATTWIATIETLSGPPANKLGPAETWISRDAGKTWTFVGKLPTSDTWRSEFIDPSHAWVRTGAGGLATTSDGGATWSVILH
jgi:photosystem II stability/assembly factor-like uncharacterized protein